MNGYQEQFLVLGREIGKRIQDLESRSNSNEQGQIFEDRVSGSSI